MTDGTERFEIRIDAGPEDVWRMLTTEEGLRSWFGTRATIDLRIDGERLVGWGDQQEMVGRIEALDPPRRLVVTYTAGGETGAEEWLISREGGTTRLTLIHSLTVEGADDWEGFYGDIRRGWRLFLTSMKHALEEANSPIRQVDCVVIPATDRESGWRGIQDAVAAASGLTGDMVATITDPPHSLLLTASDRTLLIDQEGSGDNRVFYVQAATHHGPSAWRDDVLGRLAELLAGS